MKNTRWMIGMGLAAATTAAIAGSVSIMPVAVTMNADLSGYATGSMSSARRSSNTVEMIGCNIQRFGDTTPVRAYGFCQARSAGNVMGFCSTDNAELLEAIQGIADYSYISFAWRADGTCSRIGISTQSFYIP